MSNYHIKEYSQDLYSFRLYDNIRKLTPAQIKAEEGCYDLINLAYFNMSTYKHDSAIMFGGKWGQVPVWHEYGICIDKDGKMTLGTEKEAVYDYALALPPVDINGKPYNHQFFGSNGVTYTGLKANGTVVVLLSTKNNPMTSTQAANLLRQRNCIHIFRWDGSWSSQGYINGQPVKASQYRTVRSLLLIYKKDSGGKEDDKPVNKKYKVCIDAGHGVETPGKRSPDGVYFEHEFNFDMSFRLKALLERHGVEVTLTRPTQNDVTLQRRVQIANGIPNLDLFVSIHSNASGNGATWTAPDGFGIYTSAAGTNAGRNIAANKIIARAKEAGIKLWGSGLFHNIDLYVLRNPVASAVLIEHGFHTNKAETDLLKTNAYRQKLAEIDCKGILDYLGIAWKDEQEPSDGNDSTASDWAAKAWQKAVSKGLMDNTDPQGNVTREALTVVLDRLGLL